MFSDNVRGSSYKAEKQWFSFLLSSHLCFVFGPLVNQTQNLLVIQKEKNNWMNLRGFLIYVDQNTSQQRIYWLMENNFRLKMKVLFECKWIRWKLFEENFHFPFNSEILFFSLRLQSSLGYQLHIVWSNGTEISTPHALSLTINWNHGIICSPLSILLWFVRT